MTEQRSWGERLRHMLGIPHTWWALGFIVLVLGLAGVFQAQSNDRARELREDVIEERLACERGNETRALIGEQLDRVGNIFVDDAETLVAIAAAARDPNEEETPAQRARREAFARAYVDGIVGNVKPIHDAARELKQPRDCSPAGG